MTARPYTLPRRRFYNHLEGVGYTDARVYALATISPGNDQHTFDTLRAAYHYARSCGAHTEYRCRVDYSKGWKLYFRDEIAAFTDTFLRQSSPLRDEADRWLDGIPFREVLPK